MEQFLAALAAGRPVYHAETLRSYVRDDLSLLESVDPDIVVGDFRLSLAVSAENPLCQYNQQLLESLCKNQLPNSRACLGEGIGVTGCAIFV